MFTVEAQNASQTFVRQLLYTLDDEQVINIINDDNEEQMSETTLHYKLIRYLTTALELFFREREDVFVAANLRVNYDIEQRLKWYAPDVLVAFGVEKRERRSYFLMKEKVMPQVIFEIASESTVEADLGKKHEDYARLGVEEYYLLDPESLFLPASFMAYQLKNNKFSPVVIKGNRVFSPSLNLEIVETEDTFRFFDPKTNEFLLSPDELAIRNAELQARIAELESIIKKQG